MTIHEPIATGNPRTNTDPADSYVYCTCGDWDFLSVESIGGGIEPWGQHFDQHVIDAENTEEENGYVD